MGDNATLAAFSGVADVPAAAAAAEAALRVADLVAGEHDPEAVLGWRQGRVLRPGRKAGAATAHGDRLCSLLTNGVVFIGERYFNAYAIGFAAAFECPACGTEIAEGDAEYADQMSQIGMAAMGWSGGGTPKAECLRCCKAEYITRWRVKDDVMLADMAVEFWNWPRLDRDPARRAKWWHVDVVSMPEEAVGAPAALSGHKI